MVCDHSGFKQPEAKFSLLVSVESKNSLKASTFERAMSEDEAIGATSLQCGEAVARECQPTKFVRKRSEDAMNSPAFLF